MQRIIPTSLVILSLLTPVLLCAQKSKPVDLTGKWDFTVSNGEATGQSEVTLIQRGDSLIGQYSHPQLGDLEVVGRVKGKEFFFDFSATFNGQELPMKIRGTVDHADALSGSANMGPFGNATFTATRRKGARTTTGTVDFSNLGHAGAQGIVTSW